MKEKRRRLDNVRPPTSDVRPPSPPERSGTPFTPSAPLGEALLALAVVVFGLLVIWQTTQIRVAPIYSKVGPRVIPYIVGTGLVLIGLWLVAQALSGHAAPPSAESEDVDPTLPTDWRAVGLIALALLAYLVLLEPAGFIIASAVLFVVAAFAMGSRRTARDLAIGLIFAAIIYTGFTRGLGLDLPAGVLAGIG